LRGGRLFPALAALAVLAGGCGRHRDAARDVFPPAFDPELASILLAGDDSLLVRYGYEKGVNRLHHETLLLNQTITLESEASYEAAKARVGPYRERIARCLADHFHMPGYLRVFRRMWSYSYQEALLHQRLYDAWLKLDGESDLPPEERLRRAQALLREEEGLDRQSWLAVTLDKEIARAYDEMGRTGEELATYRRALARQQGDAAMGDLARRIGTVGYVLDKLGRADSARVYYERAREVAYRMRRPSEAVFALGLLTMVARSEGHLAQAYELIMESQRVAREFRAEIEEWDALRQAIKLNSSLGAWKIVEDLLLRAEEVARNYGDTRPPVAGETMRTGLQQIRGTLLMATGRVDEGSSLLAGIREAVRNQPEREHYAVFLTDWGRSLLDAGRARQALPILEEGYAYTERENLPPWKTRLVPLLAQARLESGDLEGAAAALAEFRSRVQGDGPFVHRYEWERHDAAIIRLTGLQGDDEAAERAVREAIVRLEHTLDGLDGSESSYLFLDSCRDLRSALHERLAGDPAAGYGLELYWRSLYRRLGRSGDDGDGDGIVPARVLPGDATVEGFMTALAVRLQRELRDRGALHCLYLIGPSGVVRWTADGRSVRSDVLEVKSAGLRKDVQETIRDLSGTPEPGAGTGPERSRLLARLARTLLPESRFAGEDPPLLLVSPDGYLGAFPFETLNLAAPGEDYRPLLERTDVAYLRYDASRPSPVRVADPGVAVADPAHSRSFERRYPTLGPLPEARPEAEAVMKRSPSSTFLVGGEATRLALQEMWKDARFLYIASHFVRDAEVPYLVFLPLAPAGAGEDGGVAESSYLDLGEIRNADLSCCSLVVLSGCASGVPYSDVARSGPGLGDAFLDAGAGSVIQTFWHVDDRESGKLMRWWTERWADGETPLRALCEVRRDALHRGAPPQVWAAYGIELAGP